MKNDYGKYITKYKLDRRVKKIESLPTLHLKKESQELLKLILSSNPESRKFFKFLKLISSNLEAFQATKGKNIKETLATTENKEIRSTKERLQ